MSCEKGQHLHQEFEQAVADRVFVERTSTQSHRKDPDLKQAQQKEDRALMQRTFHVSGCPECWTNPPRTVA